MKPLPVMPVHIPAYRNTSSTETRRDATLYRMRSITGFPSFAISGSAAVSELRVNMKTKFKEDEQLTRLNLLIVMYSDRTTECPDSCVALARGAKTGSRSRASWPVQPTPCEIACIDRRPLSRGHNIRTLPEAASWHTPGSSVCSTGRPVTGASVCNKCRLWNICNGPGPRHACSPSRTQ